MKEIPLRDGGVALVSDEDFDLVRHRTWKLDRRGYVIAGKRGGHLKMHRLILAPPAHMQVDHISGDRLDNRRENLRLATASQNRQNQRRRSDNVSGFRGVSWHSQHRKWCAQIKSPGERNKHLGYFDSAREAAFAYDRAARERFGEFARLNFPMEGERRA